MNRKKTILAFVIVGSLLAIAVFGAVTFRNVYAQAPTPSTPANPNQTTPAQPNQGKPFRGEWLGMKGGAGGVSEADLAAALGVDETTLQNAEQAAATEALKQAVDKGLITQAQADAITARGLERFHFGFNEPWLTQNGIDYNALLASQLNISVDQLNAARQKAFETAINNAVQNGNLTQDQADLIIGREKLMQSQQFQSSMQSAFEAAVQQAVKDGTITQAQADQILANQANKFGRGFGLPGFDGPRGFGGRGHGRGGFPGFMPGAPAQQPTPSGTGL